MRLYDLFFLAVLLAIRVGGSFQHRATNLAGWTTAVTWRLFFTAIALLMTIYYVITIVHPDYQEAPMNPALHIMWLVIIGLVLMHAGARYVRVRRCR